MAKHDGRQHPAAQGRDRLWAQIGDRIRLRRDQIGMTAWSAASGISVELETYVQYEAGERLIPADQLATLAQLYNVPVFYFFEDLPKVERAPAHTSESSQDLSYSVTTLTERIASLVGDFQKLDFERQQCLLAVARGLAADGQEEERKARTSTSGTPR